MPNSTFTDQILLKNVIIDFDEDTRDLRLFYWNDREIHNIPLSEILDAYIGEECDITISRKSVL